MAGRVVLVPTPIGNLADITLRALIVLKEAALIAAEDTRHSLILLRHYGIETPLVALHQHNEHHKALRLLQTTQAEGHVLAVITDAGTPGISDPGFLLVREALGLGLAVEVLPGATALVPALVASGLPMDRFVFEGFLPVKKGRRSRLEALQAESRTMIFYESPYRVLRTLQDLQALLGAERPAAAARELSKLHEQVLRGTLGSLLAHFTLQPPKGEFVLLVQGLE